MKKNHAVPEVSHFATLHDCLAQAERTDNPDALIHVSFRVSQDVKDRLDRICRNQNTCVSTFLRQCCERTVHEFNSCDNVEA